MKNLLFPSIIFFLLLFIFVPAVRAENSYPRLANYYLRWELNEDEAKELAHWDLVILDMENQENNPDMIRKIREINPDVKILAYITSQEIIDEPQYYNNAWLRQDLSSQLSPRWYLKDSQGRAVVNWPFTSMLNLSNLAGPNQDGLLFNEFLPRFVRDKILASGLWDGVFYDNAWGDVAWVNGGDIDIDQDLKKDDPVAANILWEEGYSKMLKLTKELCGDDFLVVGNGRIHWPYQHLLNGMMLENFPSSWEAGGSWTGSMTSYFKLPQFNQSPVLPIINIYEKNQENYRLFRFGLASALLGDGYYSFDYDVTNHGQLWWYDEYDVNLGLAQSPAYNILKNSSTDLEPGLWRRDFENGLVILNSTDKKQNFFFSKEEFEKIKGQQAPDINNGLKINYLRLEAQDAIVLLKKMNAWQGGSFINGSFLRIFNEQGEQLRNGYFSYITSLPAGSVVVMGKFLSDKIDYIYFHKGVLNYQRDGEIVWSLNPFAAGFKGSASLAVADINGDGQAEIVIGAGRGGGPQVRVFDFSGRSLLNFFAYDPMFRGGVNVATADINGDGQAEIITGAGAGGGPHVRYFNHRGEFINHFFAYDKDLRTGVQVAAGDLNGDGLAEIITNPAKDFSQVKSFNLKGELRDSFSPFDKNFQNIISISYSNSFGQAEIAVGISEF